MWAGLVSQVCQVFLPLTLNFTYRSDLGQPPQVHIAPQVKVPAQTDQHGMPLLLCGAL